MARSGFLLVIIAWIIISPIPSALAKGPGFAANRVAVMIPAIQILSAYGAYILFGLLQTSKVPQLKKFGVAVYCLIALLGFLFFLETYFYHGPSVNAQAMSFGWKELSANLREIDSKYDNVIISRTFSEPHIFVSFYKWWNPSDYQKESPDWLRYEKQGFLFVDQLGDYKLGKFNFRDIHYEKDLGLEKTLLVGRARDFPENVKKLKTINFPSGRPAFVIVATNGQTN